jgi:hypothetical protein
MVKPSVFVGSSSEGLDFARAARGLLDGDAEITLWNEGFFTLGNTFIDRLINASPRFDFAVLVLTPDDLIASRDTASFGPRDNVIFEAGLFMGRLGRARTFMLHQAGAMVKIPSDLSGVTTASYAWPREDGSHLSAVGAACDSIRKAIRDLGVSDSKTTKHLNEIQSRQDVAESSIRSLQLVLKGIITTFEYDKLKGLNAPGPFMVRFHNDMMLEIKRLDALGYIKPEGRYGIESIRERDGRGDKFDLKLYVRLTGEGAEYLKLRAEMLRADGKGDATP